MKVALYARVSTLDQHNENQMMRLRAFAEVRGLTVVAEYEDKASGADLNRPELDRMLDDARKGKFQMIYATKLDRIMRSMVNLHQVATQLEKWGVDLAFLDQSFDTTNASGRLFRNILAAIAEHERELIGDRTRDGLERARRQGKTLGRPKTEFSAYQKEKLERLLAENPDMSIRALHSHFEGIGRTVFSQLLKEGGYR